MEVELEFHISRRAREKYHFDQNLFSYSGNVIFANFLSVRTFAQRINDQRDLISNPESVVKAGELNAMGLIDEIFHHVFALYQKERKPGAMQEALKYLQKSLGSEKIDSILSLFITQFPPLAVFQKKTTPKKYLTASTEGKPNRELLLEEMTLLWISTRNPALEPFSELILDPLFQNDFRFDQFFYYLIEYFAKQPKFGPQNQTLLDMLRTPAIQVPHSITGQLEYIQTHWTSLLGDYLNRLINGLDLINEENKLGFQGPGPVQIPLYSRSEFLNAGGKDHEMEAFSQDRDWMPRLVLIAKNSFVWLEQLSRQYKREILTLDQIPEEELTTLSKRGITGLWLIGLWERSPSSARIKQLCGNPEAIASAYSLYSYRIAASLGGQPSYDNLRERASRYGVRLASDMVPNHMGIDSEWVIHHPDRFLSVDDCPFPSYSFSGPDLSSDENVTIQIEDHYYDRTDAAVVFRRIDKRTGQAKFIYHGNDGTSMPWNDTAQLNYLDPQVREEVIRTILDVARMSPIIRFDAAMTLAKKHIQRLWFPQPGSGGAIPSRSEHSMTTEEFERFIPQEFWREVVDRVALECPDTLLLAEAFWLMESYFVRTLGMHRVYNSAFMHMLRNEDNAGYRKIIKNTLEFDPEILKRFVNFMNNPDERTAIEQFGKGDKYFGICALMATLPGLPMIGHGQIEGYAEKYGMEFQKAYWQEEIDLSFVARHDFEIFPLFQQRELFAGVENFWFYDFYKSDGVDENVYAFSNHNNGRSALVIYNNNFLATEGRIFNSVNQAVKTSKTKSTKRIKLSKGLGLRDQKDAFVTFRDQSTGLQFLRPLSDFSENGFSIHLDGYQHHVFLDFTIVRSNAEQDYFRLFSIIGHRGVPSLQKSIAELFLQPIIEPLNQLFNNRYFEFLIDFSNKMDKDDFKKIQTDYSQKIENFLEGIQKIAGVSNGSKTVQKNIERTIKTVLNLNDLIKSLKIPEAKNLDRALASLSRPVGASPVNSYTLLAWAFLSKIGNLANHDDSIETTLAWIEEWHLDAVFVNTLRSIGVSEQESLRAKLFVKIAIKFQNWYTEFKCKSEKEILTRWFASTDVQSVLQVNRYDDTVWYNRESFSEFLSWMSVLPILECQVGSVADQSMISETILGSFDLISKIRKLDRNSACRVDKLIG
jgi:glycosidase